MVDELHVEIGSFRGRLREHLQQLRVRRPGEARARRRTRLGRQDRAAREAEQVRPFRRRDHRRRAALGRSRGGVRACRVEAVLPEGLASAQRREAVAQQLAGLGRVFGRVLEDVLLFLRGKQLLAEVGGEGVGVFEARAPPGLAVHGELARVHEEGRVGELILEHRNREGPRHAHERDMPEQPGFQHAARDVEERVRSQVSSDDVQLRGRALVRSRRRRCYEFRVHLGGVVVFPPRVRPRRVVDCVEGEFGHHELAQIVGAGLRVAGLVLHQRLHRVADLHRIRAPLLRLSPLLLRLLSLFSVFIVVVVVTVAVVVFVFVFAVVIFLLDAIILVVSQGIAQRGPLLGILGQDGVDDALDVPGLRRQARTARPALLRRRHHRFVVVVPQQRVQPLAAAPDQAIHARARRLRPPPRHACTRRRLRSPPRPRRHD
mmetsp:Transcript_24653/g.76146  ORF Transcript_24653/g.76146 Transcript_24653/m.76146 type:complete len:432 (+) Transcript_24653:1059-2354(+)